MLTTSEIAATATIWVLTAAGAFFGGRAALRRKKLQGQAASKEKTKAD